MMARTLAGLASACGGTLHGADAPFAAVSTDSRTIARGDAFFALSGERFDAHDFVAAAAEAGIAGAVVVRKLPTAVPQIVVTNVQDALSRSAAAWRAQFVLPVVGVAGSNGKTTVKEMLAAILALGGECLATRGNLNNHIGVPLTLWRLAPSHRRAVIEIGANHPGEVAALAALARPTVGLVTNAGAEHLEGFGSLEGVAHAEGEMFAALDDDGVAIVNADDPFAKLWRSMTRARVVTFGLAAKADFRAVDLRADVGEAGFVTRFRLESPGGSIDVSQHLAGRHNVVNALGAAAAAVAAGATLAEVAAGLAAMQAVRGRLTLRRTRAGAWLIDDSYNANPSSMRAGIDVLADLSGRGWIAIGDMGELGEHAIASHVEIGRYARERGIERLFATGPLSAHAVEAFGPGAQWCADVEAMTRVLDAALTPDIRLLVKGSRLNRLERVVEALIVGDRAA
jgi:UDP-N-acetylmuramoyl-tripeptide--D-alanyl-D-alanine ligase